MPQTRKIALAAVTILAPAMVLGQAQSTDPVAEYESVLKRTDGLVVYNDLVGRQIEAQQRDIADMRTAIEQVPDFELQVPALLQKMVDALDEFIRLDIPFYPEERAEGLAQLRLVLDRADVSDADKFRRVLEAWEIENEYGTSYTTYAGELNIDGNPREVDFLQVGRVGLFYQTTDEEALSGAWDKRSKTWVPLGTEHRNSLRQALRMARSQIAPEMVLLPITPPE